MSETEFDCAKRDLGDELATYALGAMPSAEASDLEVHLRACPRCQERLVWLRPAVDQLPVAVPQLEPPPRLKRDLMSAVKRDAREVERRERASSSSWRSLLMRPAGAVAISVLVVAGAVGGYELRSGGSDPQATMIPALPTSHNEPGQMVATLERDGDRGTLHVAKLPPLPSGRVYQAWVQRNGVMEPSTPFVVRNDGSNEVAVDRSLNDATGVFVTREPAGGSTSPTTTPILSASLR